MEDIKQACLQSIWLWKDGVQNFVVQDPLVWGLLRIEEKIIPKWHSSNPSIFAMRVCTPLDMKDVRAVKVIWSFLYFTVAKKKLKITTLCNILISQLILNGENRLFVLWLKMQNRMESIWNFANLYPIARCRTGLCLLYAIFYMPCKKWNLKIAYCLVDPCLRRMMASSYKDEIDKFGAHLWSSNETFSAYIELQKYFHKGEHFQPSKFSTSWEIY